MKNKTYGAVDECFVYVYINFTLFSLHFTLKHSLKHIIISFFQILSFDMLKH